MQTSARIEFEGFEASNELQAAIEKHLAELESRYGRVTSGRVVVKGPGEHHRTGGQYHVNIRLALPDGREVNVGRTPSQDERYADLTFAIDDGFNRARRQLQDQARVMRGDVKEHEAQPIGTVVRFDKDGGFGFLAAADGHEVYFHRNSVLGTAEVSVGTRVTYVEEQGQKGPQASSVRLLGKHALKT
jgi:cold shock CspA family protein